MFKSSFIHMFITGMLFFVLYGACGYLTGLRTGVASLYLDFESNIPFISVFIIPYMLCDFVFVYVFFLCTNKEELKLLTKRMFLFILISACAYLIYPLQYAFAKPNIDKEPFFIRWCFEILASNDTAYNQAPSLHICFTLIFWSVIAKHVKSVVSKIIWGCFIFSIAASTLLVYQHHIIDLVIAVLLMAIVFLFTTDRKVERNAYIGRIYQVVAALVLNIWYVIAIFSEVGLYILPLFIWIGMCLYLVGNAYVTSNPSFIKIRGSLNYDTYNNVFVNEDWMFIRKSIRYVVYAPYIVGSYINWKIFRNKKIVKVGDCFIGSRLKVSDLQGIFPEKKGYVIDLTCELPESFGVRKSYKYISLPMLDIASHSVNELRNIVRIIKEVISRKNEDEFVYIHCLLGKSRSGLIAIMAMEGELINSQSIGKINNDLDMGFYVPEYLIGQQK